MVIFRWFEKLVKDVLPRKRNSLYKFIAMLWAIWILSRGVENKGLRSYVGGSKEEQLPGPKRRSSGSLTLFFFSYSFFNAYIKTKHVFQAKRKLFHNDFTSIIH